MTEAKVEKENYSTPTSLKKAGANISLYYCYEHIGTVQMFSSFVL